MSHHLELDDVLFEVRRALRLGRDQVELRQRMACPACPADAQGTLYHPETPSLGAFE